MPAELVALENAISENLDPPGGIGAYLSGFDGEPVFVRVIPGNPAFEAGLRPAEFPVAVDGVPWQ